MFSNGVEIFPKYMCMNSVRKSLNVYKNSYIYIFFYLNSCFFPSISIRSIDDSSLKDTAAVCFRNLLCIFFYYKNLK